MAIFPDQLVQLHSIGKGLGSTGLLPLAYINKVSPSSLSGLGRYVSSEGEKLSSWSGEDLADSLHYLYFQ